MIEFNHTLFRFDMEIKKILCCDCVFDQIYFLMKEKKENLFETFDKKLKKEKEIFLNEYIDETLIITCSYFLNFIRVKKDIKVYRNICVTDIIWCDDKRITICNVCSFDLFNKLDILHTFEFKDEDL